VLNQVAEVSIWANAVCFIATICGFATRISFTHSVADRLQPRRDHAVIRRAREDARFPSLAEITRRWHRILNHAENKEPGVPQRPNR